MTSSIRNTAFTAVTLAMVVTAFPQTAPEAAFDVASVRLSGPASRAVQRVTDVRVDLINASLRDVLHVAFGVGAFQLAAPDWVDTARVDIIATLPEGATRAQVPQMLRTLLRERFGLVTHVEPRPVPVHELIPGPGVITMVEVEPADELNAPSAPLPERTMGGDFETVEGPSRTRIWPGGSRTVTNRTRYDLLSTDRRTNILDATRMTMAQLARVLSTSLGEPVLDRTGLNGVYRFKIELPLDARITRVLVRDGLLTDPTGASPFTAVESLGLKLQRRQSPIDVIVVDALARTPTPN